MKKAIKIIGITFAAFFLLIASYAAYLLVTYDRIADMQELSIIQPQDITESAPTSLQLGEEYSAATYNIGFGAYTPEYSFFMDGGKSSWAASKESVLNTVEGASSLIAALDPDFALIQEIDLDATRSYHIDQYELLRKALPDYYSTFAVNYDSAFLAYPFTEPPTTPAT